MFTKIRKRDGREVPFDDSKITDAIFMAARAVGGEDREQAVSLTLNVLRMLREQYNGNLFGVEDVQDVVEKVLIEEGHARTAKAYILYRDKRTRMRDAKTELMDVVEDIVRETDKDNANVGNSPSAKMLQIASAASRNYYLSRLLDEDYSLAHQQGDIHIHDLDFYATTINCLQIPLDELLTDGFDNGHGFIRPPKRPASATALAAIILQSAQNDMYGGQSFPFFDNQLAPFIDGEGEEEIYQAMEALVYNLNSMHSRAGSQVPFSSLNLGTDISEPGRLVTRNLLLAYEAGLGKGENPIFPNIIFRLKKGINFNPEDPNYDLFQLAIRVASKRLNPTFSFMDASFNKQYGDQVAYMGCRTRVMANRRGPAVTTKRGNLSFTTLNLPRLAIKAERNIKKFFSLLDEVTELTLNQLYHRFKVQCRLRVKDIPFVMGQGLYMGSEDLKPGDSIEPAIVNGTLSVGVIGLAETLVALTGYHHGQNEDSQTLGVEIMEHIKEKVDEACERFDLNYTFLATPAEGLCKRFVKIDRQEYGIIPGVTDREYYTNSFHIPVYYPISIFDKIRLEGKYHKHFDAGHISYVELPSPPQHNLQAVEKLLQHMSDCDMGYAGINYPVDFCCSCNLLGVIDERQCPRCGSSDIRRVRRITGYLSTIDRFNDGKLAELKDRIPHG
ncbi:MAG: anaerobic ribonucleoside-triphosphate reductase [Syntrophaceticus sp.]|mgnify:CR=1 FL=1|nr:anaerobic ribonucleoside-triphosphate reductase [Syntrophaceticus sp.]MDD3314176.1 anaerobic ribonucleoside-triphosphate reductase [Syntrophaceticus sp.]MDD4359380.1 anaerobic ribonucleoside-triphosphate reductase [Syntrophaceticus sp.]MDD4782468.1 anaerobic ribonucleoside-triphosphate reductase [Syntrophaceticus sp.]